MSKRARKTIQKGYVPDEVYKVEKKGRNYKLINVKGEIEPFSSFCTTGVRKGAFEQGKAVQAYIDKNGKKSYRKVDMDRYTSFVALPKKKQRKIKEDSKRAAKETAESIENAEKFLRACRKGKLKKVRKLIHVVDFKNAREGGRRGSGRSGFLLAAKNGHVDVVKLLLKNGADVKKDKNKFGSRAIHTSAANGHVDVVKVLLENGADVNAVDRDKETALHRATDNEHLKVAKVLIRNGADVNAVDKDKNTALHCAAKNGHVDFAKVLIQNGADVNAVEKVKQTALHYAADRGHADVVKVLIQNDADVNVVSPQYGTPLHRASSCGRVDVVKVLLENGADVNAVDEEKYTALHYAALSGHVEVVKVLIRNGADVDAAEICYGRTALHWAAERKHVEVAQVLLENNADVDAYDKVGNTALHFVALNGRVDFAKLLIQNGADVNSWNFEKQSPLHKAVLYRMYLGAPRIPVAILLIKNGADVNAVDINRESVLSIVAKRERNCVFTLQLICFGANIKDIIGKTDLKIFNEIDEIMDLLRSGEREGTSLYTNKEAKFMWRIAFLLTWQYRGVAFKAFYKIQSFVTFHGIFMAKGYELGPRNVWADLEKKAKKASRNWW